MQAAGAGVIILNQACARRNPGRTVGKIKLIPIFILLSGLLSVGAWSQERYELGGEVTAMSGATLGGIGTHAVVSGSAGDSFSRYLSGVVEVAVIPMNNRTLLPAAALGVRGSNLFDFNFALHGGVPIKKWEPYGIFGLGVLMNPYTAAILNAAGTVAYVGQRQSKFGLQYGAGCRYSVGERWGVKAEYRYTSSAQNFNRIMGGVYYRFEDHGVFGFLPAFAHRLIR